MYLSLLFFNMNDTIVALATPRGHGALAVIRMSGENAFNVFRTSIAEKTRFDKTEVSHIKLYTLINSKDDTVIDEVTAIKYKSPYSYTGEDLIEIICHGNKIIADKIIGNLNLLGARSAQRGEFTRRAFLNGKTTLIKAEAIHQLIESKSEISYNNAITAYLGNNLSFIYDHRDTVLQILSDIESSIEFSEEDDLSAANIQLVVDKRKNSLLNKLNQQIASNRLVKDIEKGIDVAIVGPSNAGKSSVMNLFLGYDRSIVHNSRGTTRDFISENKLIGSIHTRIIDTAGLNDSTNEIENIGIDRSKKFIQSCRFILWVTASNEKPFPYELSFNPEETQVVLGVINKTDLQNCGEKEQFFKSKNIPFIKISANNTEFKNVLDNQIMQMIDKNFQNCQTENFIGSERQEEICKSIISTINAIKKQDGLEIQSFYWNKILSLFDDFIGKTVSDDVLNRIFESFCIGK